MRKVISIFIAIFILCTLGSDVLGQTWLEKIRQIKIFKSTVQDVKELFGKSNIERFESQSYYLKEGTLLVDFSSGNCASRQNEGWDVPEGVVTRFSFSPTIKKSFSALNISKKNLEKIYDESYQIYVNDKEDVTYEIQLGKVWTIEYSPNSKYDYLKCKTNSKDKF